MRVWILGAALLSLAVAGCGDTSSGQSGRSTSSPSEINVTESCSSVKGASLQLKPSLIPASCTSSSWVAGSTEMCQGRHIYRDYIYDDAGADTGLPSKTAGDQTYPAGAANSADLVNLHLWLENGRLRIRGELNTLFKADSTVLALAIDTDNNPETGGGAWCDLKVASKGWEVLQTFRQGDPESNVIEGSIPIPKGTKWRVQAVAAQANGTVMNVAYRGTEEKADCAMASSSKGCYFEDKQASALRAGEISVFGATISVDDMVAGVNVAPVAITPGLHSRVYTSAYTVAPGEGVGRVPGRGTGGTVPVASQFFNFLGKYQPYGIYMPASAKQPYPLQMAFHGSGNTHADLISLPGFQKTFGEQLGRVLVTPLARGPDGYGSDISERDILDVMADVEKAYSIDPDRIVASGYSQGGYIAYRMSAMYPQRFAGFISWVGFTGDDLNGLLEGTPLSVTAGAVGNMRDFVRNLRHIPGAMIYGALDPIVQLPSTSNMQQTFAATENIYRWYLHPIAEHGTFQSLDSWDKEAEYSKEFKRVSNPHRVIFRYDPNLGNATLGIKHDTAYWVSQIKNRQTGKDHLAKVYGDIDLTNNSCGGMVPVAAPGNNAGLSPVPWTSVERNTTGLITTLTTRNLLEGTLKNVASLTIDASVTCNAGKPLQYAITTDGPAQIRLTDGRSILLPAAGVYRGTL